MDNYWLDRFGSASTSTGQKGTVGDKGKQKATRRRLLLLRGGPRGCAVILPKTSDGGRNGSVETLHSQLLNPHFDKRGVVVIAK